MRLALLTTVIVSLTGCAQNPIVNTPQYKQCEYEAQVATPPSNNAIADGMRVVDLTRACMRAKGYQ